jgi:hypothetical protein
LPTRRRRNVKANVTNVISTPTGVYSYPNWGADSLAIANNALEVITTGHWRMIDTRNLQDQLAAWGEWVLADGLGLGYSSPMAAIMRGYVVEPCSRK